MRPNISGFSETAASDAAPISDGKLDDDVWRYATTVDDFHQTVPTDGASPTEITIVRVTYDDEYLYIAADLRDQVVEQVEIQAKYSGYIERQRDEVERTRRAESIALPSDLDYAGVKGLSAEVSEKLARHQPQTIGQAGRIPGVTPAAVSLLLIHLKKKSA